MIIHRPGILSKLPLLLFCAFAYLGLVRGVRCCGLSVRLAVGSLWIEHSECYVACGMAGELSFAFKLTLRFELWLAPILTCTGDCRFKTTVPSNSPKFRLYCVHWVKKVLVVS